MSGPRYVYLGDAQTRPELQGMRCDPVRRPDGRCVVSGRMATALVVDEGGGRHVVKRRRLRLAAKLRGEGGVKDGAGPAGTGPFG